MRERFETIYAADAWRGGSGEGSLPLHTRGYVRFLQAFLAAHNVRSVVDLGCGDWQFSQRLDFTGIRYDGFDLVRPVIAENRRRHAAPNIAFHVFDGDFATLPAADLLITKDVLQHWSQEAILRFLPNLARFPLCLITNCIDPTGPTANQDIPDGSFRYLDLRRPPFNLAAQEVFTFTNHRPWWQRPFTPPRWRKSVLLINNGAAPP